jgi:hypothetical protein
MNIMPIAASFVRATARRVTDGAFPPSERVDEWAIYQRDLETARQLAEATPERAAARTGPVQLCTRRNPRQPEQGHF